MEEILRLLREILWLLQELSKDEYTKIEVERRVREIIKDELGAWFPSESYVALFRGS